MSDSAVFVLIAFVGTLLLGAIFLGLNPSDWGWYRAMRGGTWYRCVGRREFHGMTMWVREPPPDVVTVDRIERYGENK